MPHLAYSLPLALPGRNRAARPPTPCGWKSVLQMRYGGGMVCAARGGSSPAIGINVIVAPAFETGRLVAPPGFTANRVVRVSPPAGGEVVPEPHRPR